MKSKLEVLDEILSGMTQEELLEELQSYESKGPLAVDFLEDEGIYTTGLYDTLPLPTTTEDVIRKGYGSYYEIYTSRLVGQGLVWKKVAWSY